MAKMKNVTVRGYNIDDVPAMAEIWNEVVKEGNAFPQKETLDYDGAKKFFASQTFCGVAEYEGETVGMYILLPVHPMTVLQSHRLLYPRPPG